MHTVHFSHKCIIVHGADKTTIHTWQIIYFTARIDVRVKVRGFHLKYTLHSDWEAGNTVERLTVCDRLNMSCVEIQTYGSLHSHAFGLWDEPRAPDETQTHMGKICKVQRGNSWPGGQIQNRERPSCEAAVITYDQAQIMFMEVKGIFRCVNLIHGLTLHDTALRDQVCRPLINVVLATSEIW